LAKDLAALGSAAVRTAIPSVAVPRDLPAVSIKNQDFFALWRDADPDIPILKQAKAEYAKLQ
jgi:hypothetical protein